MPVWLTNILPLLSNVLDLLKNAFLGWFLMKKGAEKQQLEDYKQQEKLNEEARQIKDNISNRPRSLKRKLLQRDKSDASK